METRSILRRLDLARVCLLKGKAVAARRHCQPILAANGRHAEALRLTGLGWIIENNWKEGLRLLRRALRLRPKQNVWHRDLGIIHAASGQWASASRSFRRALSLQPEDGEALQLYARSLTERGRYQEALQVFERAGGALAETPEILRRRAGILHALKRAEEAIAALRSSFEGDPTSISGHELMAECHKSLTNYDQALVHRRIAAELQPLNSMTMAQLGLAYFDVGEIEKSEQSFRRALELGPVSPYTHSIFLNALLHHPASTASSLLREHQRWAELYCPRPVRRIFLNAPDPRQRLRVGYITGQFISVPTCHFFLPAFLNHDRDVCETFCYHSRPMYDPYTEEYRRAAAHWRDVQLKSEAQILAAIRRDRIDVLVDLSGHYPYHQLRVFGRRAAPVQVAFPNYPSTTGLSSIDYLITDSWTTPPGAEQNYAETPVRLGSGYLPYQPPSQAPRKIGPLPALESGEVTFGLFQRPAKMNPGFWDATAAIMRRLPHSRLLIHYGSRDLENPTGATRSRMVGELESRGVAGRRLRFQATLRLADHLALLSQVDIALDTFPYNGQTTACECLWMGVPVITLAGDSHVSRVGKALLERVGLFDWVASDTGEYVEIAARFGGDLDKLASVRSSLRQRVRSSPLLKHRKITGELESAYREMWRKWCSSAR